MATESGGRCTTASGGAAVGNSLSKDFWCLANEHHPQSPISCRVCDKIFFDNTSLLEHFLSHFSQDGTLKESENVESSMSNSLANENTEPCAWGSVSPNTSDLSLGHETFAAQPDQSSNSQTRFASQAAGQQPPPAPRRPTGPDFHTSEGDEQSDFSFWPSDPGTSSSGHSRGTTRVHPQTTSKTAVEGPPPGYTMPYIKQLERPLQETIDVLEDVGGNNEPDEMDLTLKL